MSVSATSLKDKRVLLVGASGTLGGAVLKGLMGSGAAVGAHYHRNDGALRGLLKGNPDRLRVKLFEADLTTQPACHRLVDAFVKWAGGIEALVQLSGDIHRPCPWEDLTQEDWLADINVNLSGPFFLAQRAMRYLKGNGGRILLSSTASARHGGGKNSMAYGVAKAGIECLTKGLAREGAPHGVLVNAIAPGFIESSFHTKRMRRQEEELKRRAAQVPLGRAGKPEEVARLILFLLSDGGDYMTGECLAVSGGDWL
jgi:3-oxoacyl-[acyl-carrier protein] reductase